MNQRCILQFACTAAPVSASKQHRDTFLIHPLVQSGMRTRREKMMRRHFSRRAPRGCRCLHMRLGSPQMEHVVTIYITRWRYYAHCPSVILPPKSFHRKESYPDHTRRYQHARKHNDVRTTVLNNGGMVVCVGHGGYMRDVPPPQPTGIYQRRAQTPPRGRERVHMRA